MKVSTNESVDGTDTSPKRQLFAFGIISVITATFGLMVLRAYGILHWKIISDHYRELSPELKTDLFSLLSSLDLIHRSLGVATLAFAICSFIRREAVAARVFAVLAALVSLLLVFSIQ